MRHLPEGLSGGLPLQETLFALDGGQWAVRRSIARVLVVLPVLSEMALGPPRLLPASQTPCDEHLRVCSILLRSLLFANCISLLSSSLHLMVGWILSFFLLFLSE